MPPTDLNVKVSDALQSEVLQWVTEQITTALQDRSPMEQRWEKWIKQYEEILPESKSFPWQNACFHKNVEILTEDGWKYISEVKNGENVFSREPLTGNIVLNPVIDTQKRHEKKLLYFKNLHIDIPVTYDHNFYCERENTQDSWSFKFIKAKDIKGSLSYKIPLTGKWDAEPAIEFWGYEPDDFLELLGWYIAEGWTYKSGTIGIAQTIIENRHKIKSCLERMGVEYSERDHCFLVSLPRSLVSHLAALGKSWEKYIPKIYLDLPIRQLQILFDSLIAGDGNYLDRTKNKRQPKISYYTTSKRLAGNMQELALKLGKHASIGIVDKVGERCLQKVRPFKPATVRHVGYRVNIKHSYYTQLREDRLTVEEITYNDYVYCVTVPPYHVIYVRHNGKALWIGQSNISVPITPIAVETIHSREVNTIFAVRPYVQVKPKKKNVPRDNCARIERFLDQVMANAIDIYDKGSDWLLEKNKMGIGFVKVIWNYDKIKRGKDKFKTIDDASVEVLNIEDVVFPVNAKDLQTCAIVSHKIKTDWNTLIRRQKQGVYKNVDNIKAFYQATTTDQDSGHDVQRRKEEAEKFNRTFPDVYKEFWIYETWFNYDIDGDGYAEPLVMTIHKDSRTLLRFIYHPYEHGLRPFIDNKYQKRVNRVYAKGICEISEHLADATNTVFNQSIDNMTIANVKCFKGRKTARKDIGKIYPGKVFWLDDPTDLQEFLLGEIHQSNFVVHDLLRDYHERRTKVTDYTLGKESSMLKSRATATGTLALLQESGRHFDLIINNTRQAMVELAYQIIELYTQYKPEKIFAVDGGNGNWQEIGLPAGLENLREEYDFYCTATSLAVNKEIEKQTNLLLLQQLGGIFQQMLNLLMLIYSPQVQLPDEVKQFVISVLKSYYKMADDLVRSFEKIDVEQYLPELPELVKQAYGQNADMMSQFMKQIGDMIQNGGQQGGTQAGMAGANPFQGMGLSPQGTGGTKTEGDNLLRS
jgi:intein/homing endonuclease